MFVRLFFAYFLFFAVTAIGQSSRQGKLLNNWRFQCEDSLAIEGQAQVPGTVYTDLKRNQYIRDPFFGEEEQKLVWVAEKNWVYKTSFSLTPEASKSPHLRLKFESIDTHAEVLLNGKIVLKPNNQFRHWEVDIRPWVKPNQLQLLEVRLKSNLKVAQEKAAAYRLTLPGGEAPWIRKVQHHFGWDWSPRLPAGGITGAVSLEWKPSQQTENLTVSTLSIRKDTAQLQLEFQLPKAFSKRTTCSWTISGIPGVFQGQINTGIKTIKLPFTLIGARLWWSHDQGTPHRYELKLKLTPQGKEEKHRFGIRTIALIQEKDRWGKSFFLQLNGRPVFAKGANLVPMHVFLPEIKPSDYQKLVKNAKEAGFNLLRIWGGGTYGAEELYELCDQEGLMVWQDFMFACAMYPSDSDFVQNVREEVSQQVLRLRKHPSLALWCGNNEIDEAWHNWGWQKQFQYSAADSAEVWQGYRKLFHEVIPEIVTNYDATRPYHPSSPTTGWGRKNSLYEGDLHYWGVWWGMEPIRKYREKTGRFVSEYGFQSLPSPASLLPWLPENALSGDSAAFKNHQKHPFGFKAIQKTMDEELSPAKNPNDFAEYVYRTQIVQARALEAATHAHLSAFPRCMGSLFWQFNDCWPVASWSILDHQYQQKPAFTTIKKAFQPVSILVDSFPQDSLAMGPGTGKTDGMLNIYLLNTGPQAVKGRIQIDWIDFNGRILSSSTIPASAESGTKIWHGAMPKPSDSLAGTSCWVLRFLGDKDSPTIERSLYFFRSDSALQLPKADIKTHQEADTEELVIEAGTSLIRNLWIEAENASGVQLVDLLPGEKIQVKRSWQTKSEKLNIYFTNPN